MPNQSLQGNATPTFLYYLYTSEWNSSQTTIDGWVQTLFSKSIFNNNISFCFFFFVDAKRTNIDDIKSVSNSFFLEISQPFGLNEVHFMRMVERSFIINVWMLLQAHKFCFALKNCCQYNLHKQVLGSLVGFDWRQYVTFILFSLFFLLCSRFEHKFHCTLYSVHK